MIKLAAFCLWAVLTAVLSYRAVMVKAPAIEDDIRTRTASVITPQSDKVGIEVDGRFVTLRGPAKDEPAKATHLATGDRVWGALGPTDALWVPEALKTNYYLSAVKNLDGSVNLSGILPSNAAKEALAANAVSFFKDAVSNKIGVALPDATDPFAIPPEALQALSSLDAGTLLVAPEGITLSGSTASAQIASAARALQERSDAAWRVFVPSPAPVATDGSAPSASIQMSKTPDGSIEVRGVVTSEAARAKLIEELDNGGGKVIDLLSVQSVGLPADWDDRVLAGAQSVASLDWAALSLDATNSNLRGGGEQALLKPIEDALGAGWVAQLTPRLQAQSSDDGALTAALAERDAAAEKLVALEAELASLKGTPPAATVASAPSKDIIAAARNCAIDIKALLASRRITFESGSAELDQSGIELVASLANAAKPCIDTNELSLVISGHTDNTGRPVKNLELSRQRADAVRSAFIERGLAAEAMSAKGFGEVKPVANNQTEKGRDANRRISFEWIKR